MYVDIEASGLQLVLLSVSVMVVITAVLWHLNIHYFSDDWWNRVCLDGDRSIRHTWIKTTVTANSGLEFPPRCRVMPLLGIHGTHLMRMSELVVMVFARSLSLHSHHLLSYCTYSQRYLLAQLKEYTCIWEGCGVRNVVQHHSELKHESRLETWSCSKQCMAGAVNCLAIVIREPWLMHHYSSSRWLHVISIMSWRYRRLNGVYGEDYLCYESLCHSRRR